MRGDIKEKSYNMGLYQFLLLLSIKFEILHGLNSSCQLNMMGIKSKINSSCRTQLTCSMKISYSWLRIKNMTQFGDEIKTSIVAHGLKNMHTIALKQKSPNSIKLNQLTFRIAGDGKSMRSIPSPIQQHISEKAARSQNVSFLVMRKEDVRKS